MRSIALVAAAALALALGGHRQALAADSTPISSPANWLNWSGPYVGVHAGYFWGQAAIAENGGGAGGGSVDGLIGGGLAGYNFLLSNNLVLGVEADVGLSNAHGNGTISKDGYTYDLNHNAHLRARLGVPVNNVLFFAAAGAAFANFHIGEVGGMDYTGTFTGWTAGIGADVPVNKNLFGRIEVLYDDYGSHSYDMGGMTCWGGLTGVTVRGALVYRFDTPN